MIIIKDVYLRESGYDSCYGKFEIKYNIEITISVNLFLDRAF